MIGQGGPEDPHEAPDNLHVGHVGCVLLTISHHLFFSLYLLSFEHVTSRFSGVIS